MRKKEIHVLFGISQSCEKAIEVVEQYGSNPEKVQQEFEKAAAYNYEKISSLSIKTPDEKINHIMNNWVKKQADFLYCREKKESGIICRSQSDF